MKLAEIAALPVGDLAAEDCWLFLCITAPFLALGVQRDLLRRWGFRPSTVGFTWIKLNADGSPFTGMGYATRQNAEYVIVGRRGAPRRASSRVHSVILSPRREHSRKPDELYDRIAELVGDVPKADLFSRERRRGWESFGDEAGKFG